MFQAKQKAVHLHRGVFVSLCQILWRVVCCHTVTGVFLQFIFKGVCLNTNNSVPLYDILGADHVCVCCTLQGEDHLQNLHNVEQFVLDEADRMVEKGHFEELDKIVGLLNM